MSMLGLGLFASFRVFQQLGSGSGTLAGIPVAFLWAAALFAGVAVLTSIFTFGLQTGWEGLDSKSRALVDLLVDTQTELVKVSWPTREELRSSTTVVLVCILILSVFLYAVDLIVSFAMSRLGVLPR